jgi:hypothetical protein
MEGEAHHTIKMFLSIVCGDHHRRTIRVRLFALKLYTEVVSTRENIDKVTDCATESRKTKGGIKL